MPRIFEFYFLFCKISKWKKNKRDALFEYFPFSLTFVARSRRVDKISIKIFVSFKTTNLNTNLLQKYNNYFLPLLLVVLQFETNSTQQVSWYVLFKLKKYKSTICCFCCCWWWHYILSVHKIKLKPRHLFRHCMSPICQKANKNCFSLSRFFCQLLTLFSYFGT